MSLPRSMHAAILERLDHPLVVDEVMLPDKIGWGQVLVKVYYSGICGSQLGEIDGVKGDDDYLPHLLGHEGSGKVLEAGVGVTRVRPGDHVVMHWMKGPGIDSTTPKYQWKGLPLNAGFVTTFNEYAVVSENRLTPIPREFDLKLAQLFGCAVTTGLGVVSNDAKLNIGESIVVLGAGGVGLNVIHGAAMVSAHPIVAVDLFENKLEMAEKFGATHVVNAGKVDLKKELNTLLAPEGADVVVDTTGDTTLIALAYELAKPQGRTILVGVPRKDSNISIHTLPLHFGKVLTGSHGGGADPANDIPRYIRLYQAGKLKLNELITDRFSLFDINKAIEKMRKGGIAGRCLIEMG